VKTSQGQRCPPKQEAKGLKKEYPWIKCIVEAKSIGQSHLNMKLMLI
jgi:hypothetical protein